MEGDTMTDVTRMHLWHQTNDASRTPHRVSAGELVAIESGTWPVEPGQSVWVVVRSEETDGRVEQSLVNAAWQRNADGNSYWRATLGPFADATRVTYEVHGRSPAGEASVPAVTFVVGPKLHLALLWHQHQPLYRDTGHPTALGSYTQPWVRLHALRSYYAMAALVADHPDIHLTINLTPVLLRQLADYVEHGATDRALDLTLTPAESLSPAERDEVLSTFFDAQWHNQVFPHPRYRELFAMRSEEREGSAQDIRDLQMWFNLAWFGREFRDGDVRLVTGEVVSVHRFVAQQRDFSVDDVRAMVAEQYKVMRAIVPIHRLLQERGQIEVATTPLAHPILPLLVDTDLATIDRPGASLPPRFAWPEDAEAHVRLAIESYIRAFGRPPRGMWPAEGAVSQTVVPLFAGHGVQWIASDRGVLARSGRWGYRADEPDVLCQPYRAVGGKSAVSVFFRDGWLSDRIGFDYQHVADPVDAARDFVAHVRARFIEPMAKDDADRVLTVILDGENAWGAYRDDGRPFLHALYTALEQASDIRTVTFAEYLDGNAGRRIRPHPPSEQAVVHDLFTGSWIDESGSAPGADLGTWVGEAEENRAWALLGAVRADLERARTAPAERVAAAFDALHAAEGSDWFWWFGDDQESGNDGAFDELFRTHLRNVYHALGRPAPAALAQHVVPRAVVWSFASPVDRIQQGDRLMVHTNCPCELTWRLDEGPVQSAVLVPAGGVMAGPQRHHLTLGPFPPEAAVLRFRLRCLHEGCEHDGRCFRGDARTVWLGESGRDSVPSDTADGGAAHSGTTPASAT